MFTNNTIKTLRRQSKVIYRIPCSCGPCLETRLNKHQAGTRRGETNNLAIPRRNNIAPCKRQQSLTMQARNIRMLLIKEAIYTHVHGTGEAAKQQPKNNILGLLETGARTCVPRALTAATLTPNLTAPPWNYKP